MNKQTMYLIEKRGLYYGPNSQGYTGIKERAGRYALDEVAACFFNMDSPNQNGLSYCREEDAPEYSPSCFWDTKIMHMNEKLKSMNEGLTQALKMIADMQGNLSDAQNLAKYALKGSGQ